MLDILKNASEEKLLFVQIKRLTTRVQQIKKITAIIVWYFKYFSRNNYMS